MSVPTPSDPNEERLHHVLLAYLEAKEMGIDPDREELLAEHPDLRHELLQFFASIDEVEKWTEPLQQCLGANDAFEAPDGSRESASPSTLGQLGDFLLLREVGRGGMGIVYEAEQISLRRRVALKVLPFASAIDSRQLQRFKNEAMAAANLRHENVVPVYAVGCDRGVHYYAMHFVEGQSLASLIAELRAEYEVPCLTEHRSPSGSTVPRAQLSTEKTHQRMAHFDWVAKLGLQVARALDHAHQMGIVHRDVKPGNLLLDSRGHLWVADFGLAQVANDSRHTITGELLGTLRYASPEQALGQRGVIDHRSDTYSLGATLYELLTLHPPFEGRDRHELIRQIVEDVPPSLRLSNRAIPANLETIVLKALRKDPAERYATAGEMADDLQRFLERKPILARRPDVVDRVRSWARRHPTLLTVLSAVLVLVTVGSLVIAMLIRNEQARTKAEQRRTEEALTREKHRSWEAEQRLELARSVVDELFRISEEELANRQGMEMLRKRLLRTALTYYQELLEEQRDDSHDRAELMNATHRVARILDDLAVLRAATHFSLLCQPVVLDELHVTSDQEKQIRALTLRVGKQWAESFHDIGKASPNERGRRALLQARQNEGDLQLILTPAQLKRLRQIGLQSEGPLAFRDPEVTATLELTIGQRERIRVIEDDTIFGWMRAMARGPGATPAESQPTNKEQTTQQRILSVLTEFQARKWREMTGEPVKGTLLSFGAKSSPPFRKRER